MVLKLWYIGILLVFIALTVEPSFSRSIVKPKVTAVLKRERLRHNVKPPLVKNTSSIDEVATVRKQNRKQQWIHSAKRVINKSRKLNQPATLDKTDSLIVSMPKIKEKVRALHQALNSHRQRSRSEHKRIWKDISKTKNDVRKVLKTIASIKKNNSDFREGLKKSTEDYNKHRNDVLFRIEDIENHQKKQDLRFFNGFESTQNNSVDIAELKAQVQTLADQLEFIVQEKMLSHNQTLLKVDKSSNHFGVAVNGQLEPLQALSKEELQESQIFIEPGDYHMIEEDYHGIEEDLITETTVEKSQLSDVIGSQSLVIQNQNKTISSLINRLLKQDKMINNMMEDLEYQQESTNKLMNIVTSLGQQMRGPVMQYKDCHDLWLAGHAESGVYSIVRGMEMQPVFCNMTLQGGWTVIQRRMDGTQDFDRDWIDYSKGFGSVYGEYWLGLETIRWLTHSRIYKVAFIFSDWSNTQRIVNYDQFLVYGQEYVLSVKGFSGNEKDDMISSSNGMPFRVRHQDRSTSINANAGCTATRRSGWWFPPDCGQANPNGPYTMSVLAPVEGQAKDYNLKGKTSQPPMVRWLTWCNDTDFLKSITIQIMPSQSMEAVTDGLIESTAGFNSVKLPVNVVSSIDQN